MRPGQIRFSVIGLFVLGLPLAACGDDDGGSNNVTNQNDAAVQADAAPDAAVQADAAPDAAPDAAFLGCHGDPVTEPGGFGACCNANQDCDSDRCVLGWCSTTGCEDDADCTDTVAGLFPAGTDAGCVDLAVGNYRSFCAPGSLQLCGSAGDAPCPAGESCVLGWNPGNTSNADALRGVCLTSKQQEGVGATGDLCRDLDTDLPWEYRCEALGLLVGGCIERRCTEVCDYTDPDACPAGMECVGPVSLRTGTSVPLSGAGICGGTLCGRLQFTADGEGDVRIPGDPAGCPTGEICSFFPFSTGVAGDTFELRCIPSEPTAGATGEACEQAAKLNLPCDNTLLCIQASPVYTSAGALCAADEDCAAAEVCVAPPSIGPRRCAAKPDPGVCTHPCRTDADCPDLEGSPSTCFRFAMSTATGHEGYITGCLPWTRITGGDPPVFCDTNDDCDVGAGEGCVVTTYQSDQKVCLPHLTQDAGGVDCSANGATDCQANEACVEDADSGTFRCTRYQSFGDPCDPTAPHACLGGSCLDIDFAQDDDGTPTNTYCHGWCLTDADCGVGAVCDELLLAENDPATPADDVRLTHCRPMHVRSGAGCTVPGDCATGDGCDVSTGRCYTTTAAWGDPCIDHADCPAYGLCDGSVPGGLCYRPGCDPAAGNAGCDGTGACSDALLSDRCLEACTSTNDCSRSGEGFTCVQGACLAP
jgi:hypothetical protein